MMKVELLVLQSVQKVFQRITFGIIGAPFFLEKKLMRRKEYNPCQDRCIYQAHINCTEKNWQNGGQKTFKMFGKWPIIRVGIFEEFASFVFCALSVIVYIQLLLRYSAAVQKNYAGESPYGFETYIKVYYLTWIITFISASLFHTKDTPLTEKLDYFSAFLACAYTSFVGVIRVLWIRRPFHQLLIALPYIIYSTYHIWYMSFVSFDYGYNMKVIVFFGIANGLIWLIWCYFTRHSYIWKNIVTQIAMWSLSIFEVKDFPPILGYVDPHAIWHLGVIIIGLFWFQFMVADASYFLKKDKKKY